MSLSITSDYSSLLAASSINPLDMIYEALTLENQQNPEFVDSPEFNNSNSVPSQLNTNSQALSNIQNGSNMLNVASNALNTISNNLQQIQDLAVDAANSTNGTYTQTLQQEINQQVSNINQIVGQTQFNGSPVLGSANSDYTLQIGSNSLHSMTSFNFGSALGAATTTALGIVSYNVGSAGAADSLISNIHQALSTLSNRRNQITGYETTLENTANSLLQSNMNIITTPQWTTQDAVSPQELSSIVQDQILQQAFVSLIEQANQTEGTILSLTN